MMAMRSGFSRVDSERTGEARASTRIASNHPRRASARTSLSIARASSELPAREVICASAALGEMWRSPANEISLMNEVVVETIAVEFSGCAGGLSSGGFAEATPERHKMPNDPEISQRTRIAPCTRRMSKRMTAGSAGLSRLGVDAEQGIKNEEPRTTHFIGSDPGRLDLHDLRSLVSIDNCPGLRIQDQPVSVRPIAEVKHIIQCTGDRIRRAAANSTQIPIVFDEPEN